MRISSSIYSYNKNIYPSVRYGAREPLKFQKGNAFQDKKTELPLGFNTLYKISFGQRTNPNRLVGDVDLELYSIMTEKSKERYRELCANFSSSDQVETSKLFDSKLRQLPLETEELMKKFVDASKIYLQYKEQPIVCLGRSPKWFLNTAFWMKDGLPEYKFAAFSGSWYHPDCHGELYRLKCAPTKEEETAYRKYLDKIGVDPKTIVDNMKNTGKKTVITDYVYSGKGFTSFLEVMSNYANDLGILEDFSKSIEIVSIGSMEYMMDMDSYSDTISIPSVVMPPLLQPYVNNIKQTYHDIDYDVFKQMLLNPNTNECRSTYYPHSAWTVYDPCMFKTGYRTDMGDVKHIMDVLHESYITAFSAPMQDFRNLLNFRILDYLHSKDMLREVSTELQSVL